MTLLQIHISRDRALIASDSTTYSSDQGTPGADVYHWPDGQAVAVSKLYPLPHIRALLTGRGTNSVHRYAAEQLIYARDFDHAAELLTAALPRLPTLPGSYMGEPLRHEVHLVGWSEAHGCMALAAWESSDGYAYRVQHCPNNGWYRRLGPAIKSPAWLFDPAQEKRRQAELGPYLEAQRALEVCCVTTAAAYARAATAQAREDDPRAPYGGRLMVAELTRDEMRIVDAGDLGLPPRRPGAPDLITSLLPSLATTCIQAQAATETFADETGAGSVSIPGTGGTSFATCASRSYTNTLSRAVVVQWDAEVAGLHFSTGATLASPDDYAIAQWVCEINGTPVQTDTFIDSTADLLPPAAGTKITRTVSWQRTLNAGAVMNIYISVGGGTDINAAAISWARTRLRTSVIKA